jgi:hypothetical protein
MLNWGYIETGLVVLIALELFVCVSHLHTALGILLRWEQREMAKPVMLTKPDTTNPNPFGRKL